VSGKRSRLARIVKAGWCRLFLLRGLYRTIYSTLIIRSFCIMNYSVTTYLPFTVLFFSFSLRVIVMM